MRLNRVVWLSALLVSLTAHAQDAASADALKANVEQNLLKPLAKRENERSRFSRAWYPPTERRVRVDSTAQQDAQGQQFKTFAIDARSEGEKWAPSAMVGCIYPQNGSIYIKRGNGYRAAAFLLGKQAENPPETVCRAKGSTT